MNNNNPREENINNSTVPSVGSSWIVSKSKSRIGHVYYFNTLTGESVWNLCDSEIEKAKNNKKQLETHLLVKSPEPKDQTPVDFTGQCSQIARSSTIGPTQINIQTSAQTMSHFPFKPFANSNASYTNPMNKFTALNALSTLTSGQNNCLNRTINSLNLNNITSMYNPNVWAVPQQIFIAPTVSPLVNQAQASLNIGYNNIHQTITGENASAPVFTNYEVTNQMGNSPTRKTVHNYRNNFRNFGQRRPFSFNKYKSSSNRNDLRTKISVNKRFHFNKNSSFGPRAHNFGNSGQNSNPSFNKRQGFFPDDGSKQFLYEETPSRLDLTPLKNLAAPNVVDSWFIVFDMDVILNEFKFLNILSDSDPQCHLVVPQHVMSELENYVATSQDVQARRIQRFLSQQIEHGDVMIAEESHESEDDDSGNLLLSTCLKLSEENYHLVLLTNDNELLSYKDAIPISIFTPIEAKRLLNVSPNKSNFTDSRPTFKLNRNFKDIPKNPESDNNVSIIIKTDNSPVSTTPPKVNKETTTERIITAEPIKKTMDAAIQTDFQDFNATNVMESSNVTEDIKKHTRNIDKNTENKSNVGTVTCVSTDNLMKKRTIQLKRTISNEPPVAPSKTDEKRNFKWRRRRLPSSQVKETGTDNLVPENKEKDTITATVHYPEVNSSNSNVTEEKSKESISQDIIKKSDTSIASSDLSIVNLNVSDYNIVIEETSTSGISNTTSNVDVEIVNPKRQFKTPYNFENANKEIKTVLYEVDSRNMEEYLVMKCDEWVSRFIQIMEEALTVVLQHNPPFSHDSLPPPWTMYEAAQCIKMKFETNNAINDATFKFSDILLRVSDRRGKINTNIKPSEYMEMYSFGVHLLHTITAVVDDCEDLQIGVESLKKLLNDIQNQSLDNSTQETFADVSLDHVSVQISSGTTSQSCFGTPEKGLSPQKLQSNKIEKYDLRSSKNKKLSQYDENALKSIKVVRTLNPESSFFTSLKLRRNINFGNIRTRQKSTSNDQLVTIDVRSDGNTEESDFKTVKNIDDLSVRSEHGNDFNKSGNSDISKISYSDSNKSNKARDSDDGNCLNKSPEPLKKLNNSNHSENLHKIEDKARAVNEPKIIMNFIKCPKFEDKLKNKFKENDELDVVSELDYDEEYDDEYLTEEYGPEDEFDESAGHGEGDIEMDDGIEKSEETAVKSPKIGKTTLNNNNIAKFKYVIGIILQEIREAFYAVKSLCENYFEESKKPQGPKMKRIELRMKVKNASAHINELCKSLDSMLNREAKDSNNNIEALFRKAGFQDFQIDDESKAEYRDTITKCKNYAGVFLECIQNILTTLNC